MKNYFPSEYYFFVVSFTDTELAYSVSLHFKETRYIQIYSFSKSKLRNPQRKATQAYYLVYKLIIALLLYMEQICIYDKF